MDAVTLRDSFQYSGPVPSSGASTFLNLTSSEAEALALIRDRKRRLEQERIPFLTVEGTLRRCLKRHGSDLAF